MALARPRQGSYNHSPVMKRCPSCLRTYQNDSLKFCRVDGALLSLADDSRDTLIRLPSRERSDSETRSFPIEQALPKLAQITFDEAIEEYPAWFPNGQELVFSRERAGLRKLFRKNVVTGEESQLTSGDYDEIQPVCSPDGKTLLFLRSRQPRVRLEPGDVFGVFLDGDIWALDLASRKETRLIKNGFNPDYSPDGTKIVFQNIERTKFDVRIVDLSGGRSSLITNDPVQDINPVWSPSGEYIYFSSYRGGGINIWRVRMSADGSPSSLPQQPTIGAGQDVEIAIARDGRRLAFSILKQNADIWRLPVSAESGKPTGAPQEVITTTREDSRGAWSPDGNSIAFNSDRTGEVNIWLYSIADRSTRQLTRGAGGDYQANWSPDRKHIVFFSSRAGTADIWSI